MRGVLKIEEMGEILNPTGEVATSDQSQPNGFDCIVLQPRKIMYQDDLALWFKKFGLNYTSWSLAQDGWFMETGDSGFVRPNDDLAGQIMLVASMNQTKMAGS